MSCLHCSTITVENLANFSRFHRSLRMCTTYVVYFARGNVDKRKISISNLKYTFFQIISYLHGPILFMMRINRLFITYYRTVSKTCEIYNISIPLHVFQSSQFSFYFDICRTKWIRFSRIIKAELMLQGLQWSRYTVTKKTIVRCY